MILPRDYQAFAVAEHFRYFASGGKGNPIIAMPTGTGKSIVIAAFIRQALERFPRTRIMCVTHVKELIVQDHAKLLALWPSAPAGVYSSGLGCKDTQSPILFAGIASAVKAAADFGHVDLILVDECHLVSPKENTMYQRLIADLRKINPHLKVIGYTATHYRLGHGDLTDNGGLFTDVIVDMTAFASFNWFLSEGYLVPPVPRLTRTTLDTDNVSCSQGEYNLKELQAAVDKDSITREAVRETIEQGKDRRHWLFFASGIEHAEHCAQQLNDLGIAATFIHSKMDTSLRDERIRGFLTGGYRALVNNGILTTGFDFPALDLISNLRPTISPGLHVQIIGRGTRPDYAPGFDLLSTDGRLAAIAASHKRDCLVLDFAGNTRRLGPINDPVRPRKKGKGHGEAPIKLCEACGTYNHASVRVCISCGTTFEMHLKIRGSAYTDELLRKEVSDEPIILTVDVNRIVYTQHHRVGGIPSLKVAYHCGLRVFHEWVCFEHGGFPKRKAQEWWARHAITPARSFPETVTEALLRGDELRRPRQIVIWANKPHPEVRDYVF